MTKAPCKFHLLQGACSSPVVCSASNCSCPVVYRVTGCGACVRTQCSMAAACCSLLTRSAARGLRPRCIADPGPYKAPASRWGRGMPRLYGAGVRSLRRSRISGAPRRADTVRAGCKSACGASCCTASGTHTPSSLTSGDMNATPIYNHRSGSFGTGHPPHPQGLWIPGSLPSR